LLKSRSDNDSNVRSSARMHDDYTLCLKNIPDIFDSSVNSNYQILVNFGVNISDTTCHQFLPRPTSASALPTEKQAK